MEGNSNPKNISYTNAMIAIITCIIISSTLILKANATPTSQSPGSIKICDRSFPRCDTIVSPYNSPTAYARHTSPPSEEGAISRSDVAKITSSYLTGVNLMSGTDRSHNTRPIFGEFQGATHTSSIAPNHDNEGGIQTSGVESNQGMTTSVSLLNLGIRGGNVPIMNSAKLGSVFQPSFGSTSSPSSGSTKPLLPHGGAALAITAGSNNSSSRSISSTISTPSTATASNLSQNTPSITPSSTNPNTGTIPLSAASNSVVQPATTGSGQPISSGNETGISATPSSNTAATISLNAPPGSLTLQSTPRVGVTGGITTPILTSTPTPGLTAPSTSATPVSASTSIRLTPSPISTPIITTNTNTTKSPVPSSSSTMKLPSNLTTSSSHSGANGKASLITTTRSPIVSNLTVATNDSKPLKITLNGSDPNTNGALIFSIVSKPTFGILGKIVGATTIYMPSPELRAATIDTFTYKASDSAGLVSNIGTVKIRNNPQSK